MPRALLACNNIDFPFRKKPSIKPRSATIPALFKQSHPRRAIGGSTRSKAITTGILERFDVCLSLLDSKALAQRDQTTALTTLFDFSSEMPITSAQKAAIEEIIDVLVSTTPARGKRQLATLFLELVDRADWPEYYEVLYSIHVLLAF